MKKFLFLLLLLVLIQPLSASLEGTPSSEGYEKAIKQLEIEIGSHKQSIEAERKARHKDVEIKLDKGEIDPDEANIRDVIIALQYRNYLRETSDAETLVVAKLKTMNWENDTPDVSVIVLIQEALKVVATPENKFRGIEWYGTKVDVEKKLFSEGAESAGWMSSKNDIYRMSGTDYSNVTLGIDRVDEGGIKGWYRGVSVAGYSPSDTYACYMFPIVNGKIIHDEDKAEFYFGWYTFDKNDFSDHSAIYEDLHGKLKSIYGEPFEKKTKQNNTVTWADNVGNIIRLFINDKKDYVTLGYMAAGADARLDALQAALDAEAEAAEIEQREANKDNTDGL